MLLENGWLVDARHVPSPHHDCRPEDEKPTLLVVHNISLPPGEFGGPWIDALFTGTIESTPSLLRLRICAYRRTV
ncbi:1%2C6-anhydro-N-acetylmuramyl-L-alanine amidase AmpD [Enterobacter hormaechei]|nr:1%2C6-anhydro-N-acetylmuramyl-L-alanine amidase AmpD [Enterobacter hormaechei]